MSFPYSVKDCPGYAPGMSLPYNICERCGGDRRSDHLPGFRAAATHYIPQISVTPPALTKDQIVQGRKKLGPFPTEVTYPCGCTATGGTGWEPLPDWCPTHQQPIADAHEAYVRQTDQMIFTEGATDGTVSSAGNEAQSGDEGSASHARGDATLDSGPHDGPRSDEAARGDA